MESRLWKVGAEAYASVTDVDEACFCSDSMTLVRLRLYSPQTIGV